MYGNAKIIMDAFVTGSGHVFGSAVISHESGIQGQAHVSGNAWVTSSSWILDTARVAGDVQVENHIIRGTCQCTCQCRQTATLPVTQQITAANCYSGTCTVSPYP